MKFTTATKAKVFVIRLHEHDRARDEAELNAFLSQVKVLQVFPSFAGASSQGSAWSVLVLYEESGDMPEPELMSTSRDYAKGATDPQLIELTSEEMIVYEKLRRWRFRRANQQGVPPYVIAHNKTLKQIVRAKPTTTDDLRRIGGIRNRKIAQYGDEIMAILRGTPVISGTEESSKE